MWFTVLIVLPVAIVICWQLLIYLRVKDLRGQGIYIHKGCIIQRRGGLQNPALLNPSTLDGTVLILLLLHEDDLFFEHRGFNIREVQNRLHAFFYGEKIRGGSSISQQVVKTLLLTKIRRSLRKLLEVPYVLWLEFIFTKEEILSLYLSNIRFGAGIHGIREASWRYFGKDANSLSPVESLILFGIIPLPYPIELGLSVTRNLTVFSFRNAYWKIMDLLRFLNAKGGIKELCSVSYDQAVAWMRSYSTYRPHTACSDEEERRVTLQSLLDLHQLHETCEALPIRTSQEIGHCRDFLLPEHRELLEAGVTTLNTAPQRRVSSVPWCDWDRTFHLACWHGLILAIWAQLQKRELSIPAGATQLFEQEATRRGCRVARLYALSEEISKRCIERSLPYRIFKGMALQKLINSKSISRDPGDIDLLVSEKEIEPIKKILTDMGLTPHVPLNVDEELALLRRGEGIMYRDQEGAAVDIHTCLAAPYGPIPLDEIDGDTIYVANGYQTLSPLCYALFLPLHGLKHRWSRTVWVLDYAALLEKPNFVDWGEVVTRAQKLNILRPLLIASFLASNLFEISLPAEVMTAMKKVSDLERLGDEYISRMFSLTETSQVQDLLLMCRSLETTNQRMNFLKQKFFLFGPSDTLETRDRFTQILPPLTKWNRFRKGRRSCL